MSHHSHRSRDRDRDRDRNRSHSSSYSSSHKYDKYEHRSSKHEDRHRRDDSHYRRDDSRDRSDRYYSSHSRKKSHRDRSRSRHRSRSHSKYRDDHHYHGRSSHKSQEYKELPEPKYEKRHETMDNKYSQNTETTIDKHRSYESSSEEPYEMGHKANASSYQSTDFDLGNDNSQTDSTSAHISSMEPIDDEDPELKAERERVQKETMERLQKHLKREGKRYPPPKPQASHPIFANDGSFLEMFKSMQSIVQQSLPIQVIRQPQIVPATPTTSTVTRAPVPTIKRRGAKILKTGIVQKQRNTEETDDAQPTDSWNAYLKEVKRYKSVTCGDDNITRPLVK